MFALCISFKIRKVRFEFLCAIADGLVGREHGA